jgi:hypothetical protein
MRQIFAVVAGLYGLLWAMPAAHAQSTRLAPSPAPAYTITLIMTGRYQRRRVAIEEFTEPVSDPRADELRW